MRLGKATIMRGMTTRAGGFQIAQGCKFDWFERKFDFVYSRATWTHVGRERIKQYLDAFNAIANPGAVYLTAVKPTEEEGKLGKSFKVAEARHNIPWIKSQAAFHGLEFKQLPLAAINEQVWLSFKKPE